MNGETEAQGQAHVQVPHTVRSRAGSVPGRSWLPLPEPFLGQPGRRVLGLSSASGSAWSPLSTECAPWHRAGCSQHPTYSNRGPSFGSAPCLVQPWRGWAQDTGSPEGGLVQARPAPTWGKTRWPGPAAGALRLRCLGPEEHPETHPNCIALGWDSNHPAPPSRRLLPTGTQAW